MKKSTLYAASAVAMWATLAATTKLLLNGIPNFETLAICSAIAAIFLLFFTLYTGGRKAFRAYSGRQYFRMSYLGALGIFLYNAFYFYGISQLSSQTARILNYLWPVMLVLFSCLILKERLTLWKVLALFCSFVGVIILTADGSALSGGGHPILGAIACVLDAVAYGLFSVLNKKDDVDQGVMMTVSWAVSAVLSAGIGLAVESWVPLSWGQILSFLWFGIIPNALAYLLWAMALKNSEESASLSNMAYAVPFLSLMVSAVLLKEKIQFSAVLALIFIVGGILMQSLLGKKKA